MFRVEKYSRFMDGGDTTAARDLLDKAIERYEEDDVDDPYDVASRDFYDAVKEASERDGFKVTPFDLGGFLCYVPAEWKLGSWSASSFRAFKGIDEGSKKGFLSSAERCFDFDRKAFDSAVAVVYSWVTDYFSVNAGFYVYRSGKGRGFGEAEQLGDYSDYESFEDFVEDYGINLEDSDFYIVLDPYAFC